VLKKIKDLAYFVLNVLVFTAFSSFFQPGEAKPYPSMLALRIYVGQIFSQEAKKVVVVLSLTFNQDVTNVQLLVDGLKLVNGVLVLHVDGLNKKLFRVAFDPEKINQVDLVDFLHLLSTNPKLYKK